MYKLLHKMMFFILMLSFCDLTACVREGLYCTVGFGDSIDHYSQKVSGQLDIKRSRSLDHLLGSASLGWGHTLCQFYIAGEIGTYFPKRSMTVDRAGAVFVDSSFLTTTSLQDYVTGDVLIGFRPNECFLCYLRGGVSCSKLSFFQFANEVEDVPSRNFSKNSAAWRLGAGINYEIASYFGIGLDYIFTSYPDLKFSTSSSAHFKIQGYANYIGVTAIFSF